MPHQTDLFTPAAPAMPDGYYSGDQPNPHLRAFVAAHLVERPYDPATDDYAVPAFDQPIETTKATAIYNMHTYWSKKPHDAIREYIRHYTQPGDLVLDPFCGSGGTALAALLEGRKAIAIDRSPAATFITKNYCTPVDVDALQAAFAELKAQVKPEIDWLYATRCDRCGGQATTAYTVYSQVFQCPRCLEHVTLFDCVEVAGRTAGGKPKKINVCPHCHARGLDEEIKTTGAKFGARPVLVSYLCANGCKPARAERRHNDPDPIKRQFFAQHDLAKLQEIEAKEIPYWYPINRMMNASDNIKRWAFLWRPYLGKRSKVVDFFRQRNIWTLSCILHTINQLSVNSHIKDVLKFIFSSSLLNASDMYRYRVSGKGGLSMGTFYVGPIFQVMNAWKCFEDKRKDVVRGYNQLSLINNQSIISTQSATELSQLTSNSIDYIFTDPPYSWKVQYGESNFIWESWLNLDSFWHEEEIIVNEVRGKTESNWNEMMQQAMSECFRVLKPGRWLSLCYHDTSEGTWAMVQDIMAEAGFLADTARDALYIDTGQKAWKQLVADKVNKRDLVINFRKPKPGEAAAPITLTGAADERGFNAAVHAIIRDVLSARPGLTKDRVYDEVVSRLVRAGQMEAHNFDELLAQVAAPVQTEHDPHKTTPAPQRWYLRETEFAVEDVAESAKEDAAANIVRARIAQYAAAHPEADGAHYSDLFEHYVYAVKDKPRRPLTEWLTDYFYITERGVYRLPRSDEEEQAKAAGRQQGLNRRIKRYLAFLAQGLRVPAAERPGQATLAEWIRHCKRAGLYEQGKMLYERGGLDLAALPEAQMVAVEEDYQVCLRLLRRVTEDKKTNRTRGI